MQHLQIPVKTERKTWEPHQTARWLPTQWNKHKTTWKCWGQMMQSWKHNDSWVRPEVFWVLEKQKGTFAPEMSGLKVSSTNKKQHTLKWWFSLWKWIHYNRTDGLRLLTSFILLWTWTLIIWSIFTFDCPCMTNITSKVGTVLHSNSEIDVSHFLDEMRNVWFSEADIESETGNND